MFECANTCIPLRQQCTLRGCGSSSIYNGQISVVADKEFSEHTMTACTSQEELKINFKSDFSLIWFCSIISLATDVCIRKTITAEYTPHPTVRGEQLSNYSCQCHLMRSPKVTTTAHRLCSGVRWCSQKASPHTHTSRVECGVLSASTCWNWETEFVCLLFPTGMCPSHSNC